MTEYFALSAICVSLYFLIWYQIALIKKRYDVVDIAWGSGFILLVAALAIKNSEQTFFAQTLVTILVILWGVRLCAHIAKRNWNKPEDKRYAKLRTKWPKPEWLQALLRIFLPQAVLLVLVALPLIAIAASPTVFNSDWALLLGFDIWLAGFLLEAVADYQLVKFQQTNKGKVMDKGLWRYSRHPNYFGGVLVWWGIWIISLSINPVWWSVIGPLTITIFTLFVPGVSVLEKRYAKKTSKFTPLPAKK